MRKMWRKLFGTAALTFMLCLTGLVMSGEAQAQRFVDNGNGTVTDTQTGLMWTKNANPLGELTWHDAMSRCSSFYLTGISGWRGIDGWRLPRIGELVGLSTALIRGEHPFTGVKSSSYWSSTSYEGSTGLAWAAAMPRGLAYGTYKTGSFYVWPVRAGQ